MEFVEPIRDKKKIEAMKKVLKGSNMRDYCLFVLGINSGLRISDILNLRIDDVIDVNRKLKERIIIKEKKTGKPKDFPINESTGKAIREYLDTRLNYQMDEPLFISRKKGAPLQRTTAWTILNETAEMVGIKNIGTHTLRKTFGYHYYKETKDVAMLQKIFNHSAPSITLRYIGISRDEQDEAYLNFNL
ncbi:site-specific integrase [Paenibacillus sp. W2I17]|uniref:site-specific integrase n=1 Tax=Paenibacillus sp. W2I17 TaxID=3042311 RepID=UPI0027806131|nr:site-specific integrase [Paenibacillus sp. W2I17]MDQ0660605.1 integrase [Paenibacillus sp. W2I17]